MKEKLFGVFILMAMQQINAQQIVRFEVKIKNTSLNIAIPVQVNLDAITFLHDSVLQFVEVKGKTNVPVPYQIEGGNQRTIHWVVEPKAGTSTRTYQLLKAKPSTAFPLMKILDAEGMLTINNNGKNILRYNYKTVYPPTGVDTVYRRSGFIHPLWSPRGQELTRINAPDHYHHWGLWNPWTQVLFEGDTVDFWNLVKKQGTVRFANFVSTTSGNVFAEYKALHQHVVFKKNGDEKVALNEVQTVRVYQPGINQIYYIADITIQLNCATESPVLLLEYRYGGLGLRATQQWDSATSQTITSEGKVRKEADGSRARWCMVQGAVDKDHAGLIMMSYPTNYNYPEPLRVWPENMNKRGDVFLNFSPTKNMNWIISPGKDYVLRYRFLVFNDDFSKEKAERAWQDFAEPPIITIKKNINQ